MTPLRIYLRTSTTHCPHLQLPALLPLLAPGMVGIATAAVPVWNTLHKPGTGQTDAELPADLIPI